MPGFSLEIKERRVEKLEKFIENLDNLLIQGYGLKKHCMKPTVTFGEPRCPTKLAPGSEEIIKFSLQTSFYRPSVCCCV